MKTLLTAIMLLAGIAVFAQTSDYDRSKDEETAQTIFKGAITFADLNKEKSFDWLPAGVSEYKPNDEYLQYLKEHLQDYHLMVFMGTWCDDSHNVIPKLRKTLVLCDYPDSLIQIYGVDRQKTTKYNETKKYNVLFVPTIILFRNGHETGRIIETVKESIEGDLVRLIKKDMEQAALDPKVER